MPPQPPDLPPPLPRPPGPESTPPALPGNTPAPPAPTTTTTSTTSTSTPEPTTTTTVVPPGECVTALNSAHIQAGRANRPFLLVRALGSGDVLGFSFQSSALRQTAPGTWDRVQGC